MYFQGAIGVVSYVAAQMRGSMVCSIGVSFAMSSVAAPPVMLGSTSGSDRSAQTHHHSM